MWKEVAIEAMKPGVPASTVDKEVRRFLEQNRLTQYWRHHVGHGLGMEVHEPPFLDIGDQSLAPVTSL